MESKFVYVLDFANNKLAKFETNEETFKYCDNVCLCIEHLLEEKGYKVDQISYMCSNRDYKINLVPEDFSYGEKVIYRPSKKDDWNFGHYYTRMYNTTNLEHQYYVLEHKEIPMEVAPFNVNTWTLLGTNKPYIKR